VCKKINPRRKNMTSKRMTFFRIATVSTAALILVTGCASTGAGPNGRPTEDQVRGERIAQGAGMGCAGGAVAGALIGLALGGRNSGQSALIGAAAGCATGAVAGAVYGDYVDARSRQYANAQDRYRALVNGAESDLRKYRAYNAKTQQEVAQLRSQVAAMAAGVRSAQVSEAAYQQQVSEARSKLAEMRQRAQQLDKAIAEVGEDVNGMRSSVASTAELQAKRAGLIDERQKLVALINGLNSVAGGASS
jgi:hypothetical protein